MYCADCMWFPNECSLSGEDRVEIDVTPKLEQYASGIIVAGAGYSEDSQQVAPVICYNATVPYTSERKGYIQLDTALSSSELHHELGISVSASGKFGMFSADAAISYFRDTQEKDYSLSLNYYEYGMNEATVQTGIGNEALTESGKNLYKDGKNPLFGLSCGENYISSYWQGALLTMGINIIFSSSSAKEKFSEKAGAAYGNIASVTESVKSAVTDDNLSGSIKMHAFQIGGEPNQLSKILEKDSTGKYYVLTCSLTAIDNCIEVASSMLNYAKNEFPTQYSFTDNKGLTPLGISSKFIHHTQIDRIGLIPPASIVTQEIVLYRNQLSDKLKENDYYQQKLHPFFNKGYPVVLDDAFIKEASSILSKANSNVDILMDTDGGAADCFSLPDDCKNIKASIDSQLHNITINDLKFLEKIKYKITNAGGWFYNTGAGLATSWHSFSDKSRNLTISFLNYVYVTDESYEYDIGYMHPGWPENKTYQLFFIGKSTDGGAEYVGCYQSHCTDCFGSSCPETVSERKEISEFFFEVYNTTQQCGEHSC